MQLNKVNLKKLTIGCGIALSFGILFGFLLFPQILKFILKMRVNLKPGSEIREMWNKTPFPIDFLIYVFNITNPNDFHNGEKLKVEEIGPYYFEEWKDKYDQIDDPVEDTITFTMRNKFIFRPDKSNGLTGEEIITIPHLLLEGIGIVVQRERAALLDIVANGLNIIFPNTKATYTGKFIDIFFNGIPVDCSSEEFAAKAICASFYTGELKAAKKVNDSFYLFSIMGNNNNTNSGRFTVCRGIKNIHKLGKVIKFDDEPELDVWNGDKCNELQGTDSTIFPPFMSPDDGLWTFTPDICRSLGAVYRSKTKYAGMPALKYYLDLGDIKADESLHCFCNDPPHNCPVKGTMDLMPCINAPLIASMPHFFNGDDSLFEHIEGLNPTEQEHAVIVDFEIISGTPFKAAKRLQFNLNQEPVEKIESLSKLKNMIVPIFWIEEGIELNKTWTGMVKPLFIGKNINQFARWLCTIIGGIGMAASIYLQKKRYKSIDTTNPTTIVNNIQGQTNDNDYENKDKSRF